MSNPRPCECGHPKVGHLFYGDGPCWPPEGSKCRSICLQYRPVQRTEPLRAKREPSELQVDADVRELVDIGLRIMSVPLQPAPSWSESDLRSTLEAEKRWWANWRRQLKTEVMQHYCQGAIAAIDNIREALKVGGEDRKEVPWNPEPPEPTIPVRELRKYLKDAEKEWTARKECMVTQEYRQRCDVRLEELRRIRRHFNIPAEEE